LSEFRRLLSARAEFFFAGDFVPLLEDFRRLFLARAGSQSLLF
jgi:hypothetical protein